MALTPHETVHLMALMGRASPEQLAELTARLMSRLTWPLPKSVFHAWTGMSISVPLELCILDDRDSILLFERDDHEFHAILGLGTVLRDTDNSSALEEPIKRLLEGELSGYRITYPQHIGVVHVPRGSGPEENATRHEISLVFIARLFTGYENKGKGILYPLDALPSRLIGYHGVMIRKVAQYLKDGKPLLIG